MITVSDVKQYLYCPKIIYFDHVLHIPKPPDQKLQTGIEMHDSITAKEKRRKGAIFYDPELDQAEKMFRVEMESRILRRHHQPVQQETQPPVEEINGLLHGPGSGFSKCRPAWWP